MNILAIETTGSKASVALIDRKGRIWERKSAAELSHLQSLLPMTEALLGECELQIGDVTHVAISEGPGSFTGIRIGMATGKALAQALDIPCIGVPTLRAFIWNAPDFKGLVCPVFDARRDQVYCGSYLRKGNSVVQLIADEALSLEKYLSKIDDLDECFGMDILFFGDGAAAFESVILQWALSSGRLRQGENLEKIFATEDIRFQKASSVAKEALTVAIRGGGGSFDSMRPVYLRKAEAERKLEQRRKATDG